LANVGQKRLGCLGFSSHYAMRISSQRMAEVVAAKRFSPNADGFMNSLTCFLLILFLEFHKLNEDLKGIQCMRVSNPI